MIGFSRLRPLFRKRSELKAELTGRLNEALGGVKVVKAYTSEKREERIFANRAHNLLRNIIGTMRGVSGITSTSSLLFGMVGIAISSAGSTL